MNARFGGYPPPPPPPPPTGAVLSITANPSTVSVATSANIVWSAQNVSSCTVSGPSFSFGGTSGSQITPPLYNSASYILNCIRLDGGQESRTVTVSVAAQTTITFVASPTSVTTGNSSIITWNAPGALSCSVTGPYGFSYGGLSGNQSTGALAFTATYTLTCQRSGGGVDTRSVTVTVEEPTAITLTANPTSVAYGGSSTLTWSAANVTSCSLTGPNSLSASGTSGSITTGALTADSTYTLTCTKTSGGTDTRSVTVDVADQMVLSISASPATVFSGGVATITWSATNAVSCKVTGSGLSSDGPTSGSATTAALTTTSTYVLDCADHSGTRADKRTTVTILSDTDAAADILEDMDSIENGMRAWAKATSRSTWWSDTSLGGEPTIIALVADTQGLGKYLATAPVPPSTETGSYKYDNDANTFSCGGNAAAGVNIVLENVRASVLTKLEELVDGNANPLCGRVTYSGTTLYYKLSNANAFINDPVLKISAAPSKVTSGQSSVITWSATHVQSCSVTGSGFSNVVGASGSRSTGALTANARYRLNCVSLATGTTVTKSVLVQVNPTAPTCSLVANPIWFTGTQPVTLSWTTTGATSGTINQGVGNMLPIASGSRSVSPTQTTTYTATVTGAGGEKTCSATTTKY